MSHDSQLLLFPIGNIDVNCLYIVIELDCMNVDFSLYKSKGVVRGSTVLLNSGYRSELRSSMDSETTNVVETDEFLEVPFRMLSSVLVEGHWLDFRKDKLLESAVDKFDNITIYADHDPSIHNWLGVTKDAYFVGHSVHSPGGVNANFKIDKVKAPMVARGLKITPPSIKSCSVGISFEASLSHPDMSAMEFRRKLGEEVDGSIVRYIANSISEVYEVSLVYAGADPHAKKLFKGWSMDIDKQNLDKVLLVFGLDSSLDFDSNLESIKKVVDSLKSDNKRLENKVKELELKLEADKKFIELGKANEREIREQALKYYRAFALDNPDERIIQLLEKSDIEAVKGLGLQFKALLEQRHEVKPNGSRQSSSHTSVKDEVVDFGKHSV